MGIVDARAKLWSSAVRPIPDRQIWQVSHNERLRGTTKVDSRWVTGRAIEQMMQPCPGTKTAWQQKAQ